jgi:signal transduction histidine kinase
MDSEFSKELDSLTAVVAASIDQTGLLLDANEGFCRLINIKQESIAGVRADFFFIQPAFSELINNPPNAEGELHRGLLTIGNYMGQTRSLKARIWRKGNRLQLLAEHDVGSLEQLNNRVLQLNQDYAKSQFELSQVNLKLKQRELELEQSLVELKATNLNLKATQKQLVEAEKMAALGMMVAGVAHEINTPLGVSLGSASLLARQTQALSQRFSERSMTQSDLKNFLNDASQEAALIHSNLNRIGRLTDRFRELAIDSRQTTKSRFKLKTCLEDTITSLRSLIQTQHVNVLVNCDNSLEVQSYASDWVSIFTNLLTNSLQHGFKDRDKGNINVTITTTRQQLVVDYTDDGVGLSAETQARIFDPFFTTDLQHGMGLGMHLTYNLITQQMHGSISCLNPAGQGVHFHIEIPL